MIVSYFKPDRLPAECYYILSYYMFLDRVQQSNQTATEAVAANSVTTLSLTECHSLAMLDCHRQAMLDCSHANLLSGCVGVGLGIGRHSETPHWSRSEQQSMNKLDQWVCLSRLCVCSEGNWLLVPRQMQSQITINRCSG